MVIEILLLGCFEYFWDIVLQHTFLKKHCWITVATFYYGNCLEWNKSTRYEVQLHCFILIFESSVW